LFTEIHDACHSTERAIYSRIINNQKNMDTDELSTEAYQGILIEAEKFHHDPTLHYNLEYWHPPVKMKRITLRRQSN